MTYSVYVVVSCVTGEYYIGFTSDFLTRKQFHLSRCKGEPTCNLKKKEIKRLYEFKLKKEAMNKERELIEACMDDDKCINSQITPAENGDLESMHKWIKENSEKHRRRTSKGAKKAWEDSDEDFKNKRKELLKFNNDKKSIKIEVKTVSGEFVGKFDSIRECERELGISRQGVKKVLEGSLKSSKGYLFKRLDK